MINYGSSVTVGSAATEYEQRIIRRSAALADLSPACLGRLLEYSWLYDIAPHIQLFRQGESADRWYVVIDGWVKLSRLDADGSEVVVMLFTSGEAVAQAAIFDSGRYPVDAETADAVRLLEIPGQPFLQQLQKDPELSGAVFASLSRRLRYLIGEIEQSRSRACHLRLAELLLRLTPRSQGQVDLRLPLEKNLIAKRLGMTPATLSRAFTRLTNAGVHTRGSVVHIDEVARLRQLCGQ